MKPWLLKTAGEYEGKAKFVAVDVDKSGDVAQAYEIKAMPTFLIMKGDKEVGRIVGGGNKKEIISSLKRALEPETL